MVKLKKKMINGKVFEFRDSDRVRFERKFFLGSEDATEKAINKQLMRKLNLKKKKSLIKNM